jgi:GNAT superfamily N-acetyltransferase
MPHRPIQSPRSSISVSDDSARVDLPQLAELFDITWWAKGRAPDQVRRALEHSHPILTAWEADRMVGFARVISDQTYRATIWDVIVRPGYQGRGIGASLVRAVLDHPDLKTVSLFLLLTKDRHRFYERLGFTTEHDMSMIYRR